ncbi:MAG TPA: efflux RND transporter permease subunit, partial [Thermoanaerobaculia bacterium]|nr:efflux RND transporter permease subunit [Thermoanaerobaculia bacterium]
YVSHVGRTGASEGAVTIAVTKRKGANATEVTRAVVERVDAARGRLLPRDVNLTVTRDYGETAGDKARELILHLALATLSVTLLIWVFLGWREAAVVLVAVPVTLALTLFVYYALGYTLNRITLFALIFSIGILVDDAIVVVENTVRHYRMRANRDRPAGDVALEAVAEVGNPTILATFAVVAAILPMGFVRGLMGPYMRPIPVGATAAMLFSLLVAFIVTPWASVRLLRSISTHGEERESRLTRLYRRVMHRLVLSARWRTGFLVALGGLLVLTLALVPLKLVRVKMLPFDNKSEFQIMIDTPEGTPLESTLATAREIAATLGSVPEVANAQIYAGTASPYNFNGLVRHYFLRRGPNVADIQVNLVPKGERSRQSHEVAKAVRNAITAIALRNGARVKVAEVPPGPPVLQTLVAEVYGPDYGRQIAIARQLQKIFDTTAGVVDVDTYIEDDQEHDRFVVDKEKAALSGVTAEQIAATLRIALSGYDAANLHAPAAREAVPVTLRLPRIERSTLENLEQLRVVGSSGNAVPLGSLVRIERDLADKSIYHKNLMPVVYVTADVAGSEESPVYAILKLNRTIAAMKLPEGYELKRYVASQPFTSERFAMKWDGEWHITYEVFRDLGLAFAVALLLIYVLVVGWFESFKTPLAIMAAIPFSLVGILPAHAAMGAFFTATSMIGFIAGAGIVVRNSIILVDFIELRVREGMPLAEAVIDAGAVRFRPMMLTAAAVVVGASVILFDPIFQGLALSLMAGEIASLALSRVAVPILYYLSKR